MTDQPKRIFVPGQAAGPTVSGAGVPTSTIAARAAQIGSAQAATVAPVGERVARQYPWMASIRMDHGVAENSYTKFMRTNGEPGFYNAQRRRIYIDEIRIFAAPVVLSDASILDIELARHVGVKLSKQSTRYIDRFIPLWNINTERNRINQWFKFNGIFRLPTKYYLQRGSVFTMKTNSLRGLSWYFGLHGKDPINNYPHALTKTLDISAILPQANSYTIVFDENRDVPLRDCEIDVIALGVHPWDEFTNSQISSLFSRWASTYASTLFQFQPPEGPQWHTTDDWFPFESLLWQPGLYTIWPLTHYYYQANHVIHRPVTPYILDQREEFIVELSTLIGMTYQPGQTRLATLPIYCTLFGRQEAL